MALLDDETRQGLIYGSLASGLLSAVMASRTGNDPMAAATMGLSTGFGKGLSAVATLKHQELEEEKSREMMRAAADKSAYFKESMGLQREKAGYEERRAAATEQRAATEEKRALTNEAHLKTLGGIRERETALKEKADRDKGAQAEAKRKQVSKFWTEIVSPQDISSEGLRFEARPKLDQDAIMLAAQRNPLATEDPEIKSLISKYIDFENKKAIEPIKTEEKIKVEGAKGDIGLTKQARAIKAAADLQKSKQAHTDTLEESRQENKIALKQTAPAVASKKKTLDDVIMERVLGGLEGKVGAAPEMPGGKKSTGSVTFAEGSKTWNVPAAELDGFLKLHPNAKRK